MDDREIIGRVRGGEVDAYALLVEKYHRNLLRFIYRLVGDAHLAEDLGQEVFLKVYRQLPRFDTGRGTPFAAWLYTVARNQCLSELRRRGRQPVTLTEEQQLAQLADGSVSAEAVLLQNEELAALHACLEDLPEPFRRTLLLSLQGASLAEIAREGQVAPATVKTRLFRARRQLALMLKAQFGGCRS